MSYNIQGNLAIQVKGDDVKFLLYPANAFLSPDKSCAVLYQATPAKAKILKLKDGYLVLESAKRIKCKDLLYQIALQNKTVVLTVNCADKKITGFTYPAPRV